MVKGAIFDFDGTLVDSMFIWDTFGEDCLKSFGIETGENLAEVFSTFTLEQAAEYYRDNYGIVVSVEDLNNLLSEIYGTKVCLKPGVNEFLKRLYNSGVRMCVATVSDGNIAENVLTRLGIRRYFTEIITGDKKFPGVYREALKKLGTLKEETVVFEDVLHALLTAKNDGFKVAAVYDSHEPRQSEMKECADYYIRDFGSFCFSSKMKTSLTIAGSDSSGGAGIQADIKTMTMNGVYAMSAVTALTAQNTLGVKAISDSTPEFLKEQLDSVFEDIFPDSVKIGMVSSDKLVDMIADRLKFYKAKNIVADPVMISTSGCSLIKDNAVKALKEKILPIATVVTPNIPEAEILSGMKINTAEDMIKSADFIEKNYGCAVLLKGGHSINDANDLLCENGKITWFYGKRIDNPNTHGTGCTLSSAIASNLAKGLCLEDSVKKAKEYISGALASGLELGKGAGPLMHNFRLKG